MLDDIKIGLKKSSAVDVTQENTAAAFGTGALEVFSTPAMITLMEDAAFNLLKAPPINLNSVGTGVFVKHTRACLPGTKVVAEAEITEVDRKAVTFRVTAYDDKGEIGSGTHTRFIVDPEEFMRKLKG